MGTRTKEVIAVAIDFGTTYSAVAFAQLNVGNPNPVQIGDWPGQDPGETSFAVPTVVVYPDDGGRLLWGFKAEKDTTNKLYPKFRIFKPFIEPNSMSRYRTPPGKTLKDVVHDYLQGLYEHLIEHLIQHKIYSKDGTDLDILLTVPAAYSDSTVENFRYIVETTGIGHHTFGVKLTEPEAAGLYTIDIMGLKRPGSIPSWKKDGCFIVCDAGGGTVDVSSYNILRLNPSFHVAHTNIITGSYCGSTMIDKGFAAYVRQLVGDKIWQSRRQKIEAIVKRFILEKERFDNSPNEENFNILFDIVDKDHRSEDPLPDDLKKKMKGSFLPISRSHMQELFAISLNDIKTLLVNHIEQCKTRGHTVGAVFLVGGLGSSPYTKQKVEEYVRDVDPAIQVYQPRDAQEAVVRGTITKQIQTLKKLEDPVQSRLIRKHYGLVMMKPFNERRNFEYEKFVDPVTGIIMAKDQIEWLTHKSDKFVGDNEKCIERLFKKDFFPSKDGYRWKEIIVECTSDDPPFRVEPGIRIVCTLIPDLSTCPPREFERIRKKREGFAFRSIRYYHARYKIKIHIGTVGIRSEMFYRDEYRPDLMAVEWAETGDENDDNSSNS